MTRMPLAAVALVLGIGLATSADAAGPDVRSVTLALSPENAAVAVDGHPRQHPGGVLELRGALGSVFTVEAVANGASIVERVAITDVGALPARLVVPAPAPAAAADCAQRTFRDTDGVKHYKPECLSFDAVATPTPTPAASAAPRSEGFLTLASYPWTKVSEGGRSLCITPCNKVPLAPGLHLLQLENEASGLAVSVAVTIRSGELLVKRLAFQ